MAIDPDILATMKQTIFIAHQSGINTGKGDPQYGAPIEGLARVEAEEKEVRVTDGKIVKTAQLVMSNIEILLEDRIWALGANPANFKEAKIIQVAGAPPDENGNVSHWEARY